MSASKVEPRLVRRARIEMVCGLLTDFVEQDRAITDTNGEVHYQDKWIFDNDPNKFIHVPEEDRFGLNFDVWVGREYSVRWGNVLSRGVQRRGCLVLEGGQGFEEYDAKAASTASVF